MILLVQSTFNSRIKHLSYTTVFYKFNFGFNKNHWENT